MPYILIAISIVFGVLRFIVPVSGAIDTADIFKDLAHIWLGILIGFASTSVYIANGAAKKREPQEKTVAIPDRGGALVNNVIAICLLPISLTVLEVVAFIIRRK